MRTDKILIEILINHLFYIYPKSYCVGLCELISVLTSTLVLNRKEAQKLRVLITQNRPDTDCCYWFRCYDVRQRREFLQNIYNKL